MRSLIVLLGMLVAVPAAVGAASFALAPAELPLPAPSASILALAEAPPARWEYFAAPWAAEVPGMSLAPVALPHALLPSAGILGVLAEAGLDAGAVDAAALAAYDALPAPQRDALGLLLAAHLLDAAWVREAYADAPADLLDRAWGTDLDQVPVDFVKLVAGQRVLLAATQAAMPALRAPLAAEAVPPAVAVCDAVLIDLGAADNHYTCEYRFAIDAAGDDRWSNNAGGNGAAITLGGIAAGTAGFAADLAGDDLYDYAFFRGGAAGSGAGGAGFLYEGGGHDTYAIFVQRTGAGTGGADVGVGTLLEMDGDDSYYGANGIDPTFHDQGGGWHGGSVAGLGLLVEFAGNDVRDGFVGGSGGLNGGTHGGVGVAIDYAGDDTYDGFTKNLAGVNGGAFSGAGFLLDHGGDDRYNGVSLTFGGVNGGAFVGTGLLVDINGNDDYDGYVGQLGGVNGGGFEIQGTGQLFDYGGNDHFTGFVGTSGGINGGSFFGFGMLVARGGNDWYETRVPPGPTMQVNGCTFFGSGLLADMGGTDFYRKDPAGAWAQDQTITNCGANGTQYDAANDIPVELP